MRLFSILIFLLFTESCHAWKCQGTCQAMNQMAQSMDTTCTKSSDCLILTCGTPRRASQYGAVAEPTFQIYPCTDPVILNLKLHGSFLGQSFNENKNFTGDSSFPETMTLFGRQYTVYIHVTLRQMSGQIRFGMTASYGSKYYTLVPQTDIPIDKSGCPGVESTTHNPLCIITTPTQLVTTVVTTEPPTHSTSHTTGTETMVTSSTTESMVASSTTESMVASSGTETMVTSSTTESMVASSGTETMVASSGTETMVTSSTTESMMASSGIISTVSTDGANQENSSLIISQQQQQQQQQLVASAVSGSVVVIVFVLILSIISTLVIVYFILQKRRKFLSNFRYSNIKESIQEI